MKNCQECGTKPAHLKCKDCGFLYCWDCAEFYDFEDDCDNDGIIVEIAKKKNRVLLRNKKKKRIVVNGLNDLTHDKVSAIRNGIGIYT